jgi:pyruvate/2-oxoglutarate dehydrogenase complex dihydrolipoamide acyltransferase (E2) component
MSDRSTSVRWSSAPFVGIRRKIAEDVDVEERNGALRSSKSATARRSKACPGANRARKSEGVKLTYLAFIAKAVTPLRRHPTLNSMLDDRRTSSSCGAT